jgi:hypothetical protein
MLASLTAALAAALAATKVAVTASTAATKAAIDKTEDTLKGAIKESEEKVVEEIDKTNFQRIILMLVVTSKPSNSPVTLGTNGAPNKFVLGWVQFYRVSNNKRNYFERQFIINDRSIYVSPIPADICGYVVHLLPSVIVSEMVLTQRLKQDSPDVN